MFAAVALGALNIVHLIQSCQAVMHVIKNPVQTAYEPPLAILGDFFKKSPTTRPLPWASLLIMAFVLGQIMRPNVNTGPGGVPLLAERLEVFVVAIGLSVYQRAS